VPRKISAVVFPAPNEIEIQQFELPPCGEDDVVVKTLYSMVSSGTELRTLSGHATFPMIPGYSAIGEIVEIGPQVKGYKVGDLISGRSCPRFIPVINEPCGGHASGQVYPASGEDRPVLLPPGANPMDYVATEISSISLRGVIAAAPQPGETAVVVGQGLIGAFSAAWLHARGCHVVVADVEERRLERALKWSGGKLNAVNVGTPDGEARIQALVNGGADIVVESSGTIPGVKLAYQLIRSTPRSAGGSAYYRGEPISLFPHAWPRLIMQASYTQEVTVHPHGFFPGEGVTILTPGDRALEDRQLAMKGIWKGEIRSADFVDHVIPHTEAPTAYRAMRDDKNANFSIIFDWTKSAF
jgi:threonine dehydrogenase-like Zn-dependent dehydrogenase